MFSISWVDVVKGVCTLLYTSFCTSVGLMGIIYYD